MLSLLAMVGKCLLFSGKEIRFDNLEPTTFFEARINLVEFYHFVKHIFTQKARGSPKGSG